MQGKLEVKKNEKKFESKKKIREKINKSNTYLINIEKIKIFKIDKNKKITYKNQGERKKIR